MTWPALEINHGFVKMRVPSEFELIFANLTMSITSLHGFQGDSS